MPELPDTLAPSKRYAVERLLSEVTLVDHRPDPTPEPTTPGACGLCPRTTGQLVAFRFDPRDRPDHITMVHIDCRRKYLHRKHRARRRSYQQTA